MHEIKTGKATIMLVEVRPNSEVSLEIEGDKTHLDCIYEWMVINDTPIHGMNRKTFNRTDLKFLCTTTDITEYIAAGIVETSQYDPYYFVNYEFKAMHYKTAVDSFLSLLQKHSLTGRYAIIQVI